jgi:hypothetical protein
VATTASTTFDRVISRSDALPSVPWYIWCAVLAVTSAMIGAHWDISWHSSVGRDTFWTPAHIAIYLCGVLSGVAFGYLILSTTFVKSSPLRDSSVHIWGFSGPLGAFIASWGGIAMLTSAPFDDWWHAAYGLDVKIVSPPHIILFIGTYAVLFGTLVLIAGYINRATGEARRQGNLLFLYVAGITLIMFFVLIEEYTFRSLLHSSTPYIAMSLLVPLILAATARATSWPFAATIISAIYTFVIIALILILPLFPAEPKLGPVYQHVTQFIPPQFPMLVIVPAFFLDLLWPRLKNWNPWAIAAVSAVVFVTVLLAAEWPFASFLQAPASRNRFFGTMYFNYAVPPTSYGFRHLFYSRETAVQFWEGIAIAVGAACLSFRAGVSRGDWMKSIQR